MTSPHNSVSILSRSSGARAVASAAYRHATQMQDGRGGPTQDYSGKRRELKHAEVMLPADAAGWARAAFGPAAFEAALRAVRAEAAAEGRQLTEGQAERAAWARVSERLWTSVEDGEDRLNRRKRQAQLARMVIVALPRVLSRAGQIDLPNWRGLRCRYVAGRADSDRRGVHIAGHDCRLGSARHRKRQSTCTYHADDAGDRGD
ncbi:MobA/MobL family protein [Tateyamaria sp.]|uniref:MobA/MobL family protein n=1 Tax=Tateyamaria sp. TaxID=1929288 RepID=UPI003B218207